MRATLQHGANVSVSDWSRSAVSTAAKRLWDNSLPQDDRPSGRILRRDCASLLKSHSRFKSGQGCHAVFNGRDELARNRAGSALVDKRRGGQHTSARLMRTARGHASPALQARGKST